MSDLHGGPPHRFDPVGRCIYCGASDVKLGTEHVVPLALGGGWLLPDASCSECAKKTGAYEGVTSRTTLGNLRMRHGFPTRRKKARPEHIEIGTVDENGRTGFKKVAVTEYPVGAFIPHFGRAGILVGLPPNIDSLQFTLASYSNDDIDAFKKKHNWDGRLTIVPRPVEFGQTICKIAYCYAVGSLGLDGFTPLCLDQVLSRTENISYVFGQRSQNVAKKGKCPVWTIECFYVVIGGIAYIIAHVSFLPDMGTPVYEVVVGYVGNEDQRDKFVRLVTSGAVSVADHPVL